MLAYYAGRWQDSGRPHQVENPFDQSVVDTVPDVPPEAVDEALRVAREGVKVRDALPNERLGQIFKRVAETMRANREEVAQTITAEEGKLLAESRQEVEAAVLLLEASANNAFRLGSELTPLAKEADFGDRFGFTMRRACGVVVAITPYTYPLLLPCVIAIPALIAGNAVVLKPARTTPLSALRLVDLLLQAGLPETVIACLTGAGKLLGPALCQDPRVDRVVFIGARQTATSVQREAGLKPIDLQWGGVGAVVVAEDANLDSAAAAIVESAYENAGQIAFASPWVLAAKPVYTNLVERLQTRISALTCGDPSLPTTRIGPLIGRPHAENVAAVVQGALDRGARCCCGGGRKGAAVEATLLYDVAPDGMVFTQQEFLGPVVGVSRIEETRDAERFLDPGRQLVVSIFSPDTERVMHLARSLEVANVHVNGVPSWRDGLLSESRTSFRIGRQPIRDRAFAMTTFKDIVHHPRPNDFDAQLKHFLETSADLKNPINGRAIAGCAFSPEVIHRLRSIVLRHGRAFPTRQRDYPIPEEERKCFKYAQNMAMERGLGYVEGFALGNQCFRGALPGGLAFFHGWCVEKDGAVVDLQWRNYGAAYFGIEFSREYLTSRFNFFLKREQETGKPMIPFLCADDFDESAANWKRW